MGQWLKNDSKTILDGKSFLRIKDRVKDVYETEEIIQNYHACLLMYTKKPSFDQTDSQMCSMDNRGWEP